MALHKSGSNQQPTARPLSFIVGSLLPLVVMVPTLAQKNPGDIVVVGNSPSQWSQNLSNWNQLVGVTGSRPPAPTTPASTPDTAQTDPAAMTKALLKNIQVSAPQLQPIIKLPGSSQVSGSVTNRNKEPVTIAGVNFIVLDRSGNVIQTGTAVPEPATIGPGQTVTYQQTLLTVPSDVGATVRLGNPSVSLQGGV